MTGDAIIFRYFSEKSGMVGKYAVQKRNFDSWLSWLSCGDCNHKVAGSTPAPTEIYRRFRAIWPGVCSAFSPYPQLNHCTLGPSKCLGELYGP